MINSGETLLSNWIDEMLKGNEDLLAEVSTSTDAARLYEIISNTDDLLVLSVASTNRNLDILSIEYLAHHYLQQLVANDALAAATHNFADRVQEIFAKEFKQIVNLQIHSESQWWDWLLQHPLPEVRQATSNNRFFPDRLRASLIDFDSYVRLGFVLNKSAQLDLLKQFLTDEDPAIRKIVEARIQEIEPKSIMDFSDSDNLADRQRTKIQKNKAPLPQYFVALPVLGLSLLLFLLSINNNSDKIVTSARGGTILKAKSFASEELVGAIDSSSPQPSVTASSLPTPDPKETVIAVVDAAPSIAPSDTPIVLAAVDHYEAAIEFANEATLLSKSGGKERQQDILALWGKAIDSLKKVEQNSPNYTKSQEKIRKYGIIRDVVKSNYI